MRQLEIEASLPDIESLPPAASAEPAPAAPAVVTQPARLLTVFIGNCQISGLSAFYRKTLPPDAEHDVRYVAAYEEATPETLALVARATTVVQQVLNSLPKIGEIAVSARRVLVPHIGGMFLWPYGGTPHVHSQPDPLLGGVGPYNKEFGDSFLNRMIVRQVPADQAVADYLAADRQTRDRAERMMELHTQNQRERDALCDLDVAGFIEARLRGECLFRSPNHPVPALQHWVAAEICARMGVPAEAIAAVIAARHDGVPQSETPVHPAVAQHFGLAWATPERRYRFHDEGGFTFVEFAGRYMRHEWSPDLPRARHMLAHGDRADAIALLEAVLPSVPRSAVARGLLADELAADGRLQDALVYACEAVALEPLNRHRRARLTQLLNQFGKTEDGRAAA